LQIVLEHFIWDYIGDRKQSADEDDAIVATNQDVSDVPSSAWFASREFSTDEQSTIRQLLAPILSPDIPIGAIYTVLVPDIASEWIQSGDMILLEIIPYPETHSAWVHGMIISQEVNTFINGNMTVLANLLELPIVTNEKQLDSLSIQANSIPTLSRRTSLIKQLLQDEFNDDLDIFLTLLGGLIHGNGLAIINYPTDDKERYFSLIQTLLQFLPTPARQQIQFAIHAPASLSAKTQLVFVRDLAETSRFQMDWQTPIKHAPFLEIPYIAHLRQIWTDDDIVLSEYLREINQLAQDFIPSRPLLMGLNVTAQRHSYDRAIHDDLPIDASVLMELLRSDIAPEGELYEQYLIRLLEYALDERDLVACDIVAQALDDDAEMDLRFESIFEQALNEQPDAVYTFMRARCATQPTDRWLQRLYVAGERSLDVAITDGDSATLVSWLRLLSREPQSYGLDGVLHEGILRALHRAPESIDLASTMLTISLKRDEDLVVRLLNYSDLFRADPNHVLVRAIKHHESDAIDGLSEQSRELFLLAVGKALSEPTPTITPAIVQSVWDIYVNYESIRLIDAYQPLTLIHTIASAQARPALTSGVLEHLLRLELSHEADDLFMDTAYALAEQTDLASLLAPIFLQSGRTTENLVIVVNNLITSELITAQQTADIYGALLVELDWQAEHLPYMEQLARTGSQFTEITIPASALWKLLTVASENRNELIIRSSLPRILDDIGAHPIPEQMVDMIERLRQLIHWYKPATNRLLKWWREMVLERPLGEIQKLERAIGDRKNFDDLVHIIGSAIAIRRTFGNRTLAEIAVEVQSAFILLSAFAENFDLDARQSPRIDLTTIRQLITLRQDELLPDERHVLATNLKSMAQLITSMSENRSKPSLIRSDESLDRQIISGEQPPQGSIDFMKWLSGHLENHNDD